MITDFVLELDGGAAFAPASFVQDDRRAAMEAYFRRRDQLSQKRTLFKGGAGVQGSNIEVIRDALIADMRRRAGGKFEKAGVLCLFGSSNGAAVALAMAVQLQRELTINYLCLADLPMFASGRNPPIPGIGNVKCSDPVVITTARSIISSRTVSAEGDRPSVILDADIDAKVKENVFQHNGNSIKAHTFSPGWFWTSDMKNDEVHGRINNAGWRNLEALNLTLGDIGFFQRRGDVFHQKLDDFAASEIFEKRFPAELAKI
ncbi:MAG TPA: hypothetical protein VNT79_00865 [Phycisphaerae bacterium]|nr:hypothetical protein [Phycisphaerae bacterium]